MKLLSFVFVPSKKLKEDGYSYHILKELKQKINENTSEDVVVMAIGCEKKEEIKYFITKLALTYSDLFSKNPTEKNHNIAKWSIWCFGQLALNPTGQKRSDDFFEQIRLLCDISNPIEDMLCITCNYDSFIEYQNETLHE